MILGVGSDLIDIRRIEAAIARFGDRFIDRIFTEAERRRCERRANPGPSYARRFAAKEAAAKAFWLDLVFIGKGGFSGGSRSRGAAR